MRLSLYYHKKGLIMKKKHLFFETLAVMMLAVIVIFALAACGSDDKTPAKASPKATSAPTSNPDDVSGKKVYKVGIIDPRDSVYAGEETSNNSVVIYPDGTAELIEERVMTVTSDHIPGFEGTGSLTSTNILCGTYTVIEENTIHVNLNSVRYVYSASDDIVKEAFINVYAEHKPDMLPKINAAFTEEGYTAVDGEGANYLRFDYEILLDDANARAFLLKEIGTTEDTSTTTYTYNEDGLLEKSEFINSHWDSDAEGNEISLIRTSMFEYDGNGNFTGYTEEVTEGSTTQVTKYAVIGASTKTVYSKTISQYETTETFCDENGDFVSKTSVSTLEGGAVVTKVYRDYYSVLSETTVYPDGKIDEYIFNDDGTTTDSVYYPALKVTTVETRDPMGNVIDLKYHDENGNNIPVITWLNYDEPTVITVDGIRDDAYDKGAAFLIPSVDGDGICAEITFASIDNGLIYVYADVTDPVDSYTRFIDNETGIAYGWKDAVSFKFGKDKDRLYRWYFMERDTPSRMDYFEYDENFKIASNVVVGDFVYREKEDGSGWIAEGVFSLDGIDDAYNYGEGDYYLGRFFYFEVGVDLDAKLNGIPYVEYTYEDFMNNKDTGEHEYVESYISTTIIIR